MRLRPLIAACKSLASVGKLMFLGCTVVSTVKLGISLVGYPLLWLAAGAAGTRFGATGELVVGATLAAAWVLLSVAVIAPGVSLARQVLVTMLAFGGFALAAWQVGSGRALAFTGEADGKYAGDLAKWPSVGDFHATLAEAFDDAKDA